MDNPEQQAMTPAFADFRRTVRQASQADRFKLVMLILSDLMDECGGNTNLYEATGQAADGRQVPVVIIGTRCDAADVGRELAQEINRRMVETAGAPERRPRTIEFDADDAGDSTTSA